MSKKLISIVVPMYNEESTLEMLYEELNNVTWAMPEYSFEYVFINDGSKDRTAEILRELAERMRSCGNFGVCLDYAHAVISGTPVTEWLRQMGPYIKHIHKNFIYKKNRQTNYLPVS